MSPPPQVSLRGGYQSPSIILRDKTTHYAVPLGGIGSGPWDTVLAPSTDYEFSVELDLIAFYPLLYSGTITVRFWSVDGGLGLSSNLLETQVVNFDSLHYTTILPVTCGKAFTSAPLGEHRCAAVSISDLTVTDWATGRQVDPGLICTDEGVLVPEAGSSSYSCCGWRNTESRTINKRGNLRFKLGLGEFTPQIKSTHAELEIQTQIIPTGWHKSKKILELKQRLKKANVKLDTAFFLLPGFRDSFEHADLKLKIEGGKHLDSENGKTRFLIAYDKKSDNSFELSGPLPGKSKNGDIILVNILAHYKNKENTTVKSNEFLLVVYVVDKKPDYEQK